MQHQPSWGKPLIGTLLALSLTLAAGGVARAQTLSEVQTSLARWDGPKRIVLRSDQPDPLAVPLIQDLLEQFLAAGFQVDMGSLQVDPAGGLIADVRTRDTQLVLVLTRASDRSVLSMHRFGTTTALPKASSEVHPDGSLPANGETRIDRTGQRPWPVGPIALGTPARGIAFVGSVDDLQVAVLRDDSLALVRITPAGIEETVRHTLSQSATRALSIGSGDLDDDGVVEVAAVWAEDSEGVYDGTDTQLHSWIFRPTEGKWQIVAGDLRSYLRVAGGRVFAQSRGPHRPFAGPVVELRTWYETAARDTPVPWGARDLFEFTPLGASRGLARNAARRLELVAGEDGSAIAGGLLLEDLGSFRGPHVAIRLETPEYRSGFEKEDRITETLYRVPPRVELGDGSVAYTIQRGRTTGLPLLGSPSGRDRVVRLRANHQTLSMERPFPEVDAFVLDFALLTGVGQSATAAVLVNEREDGSGEGFLLFQTAR